jgi:hypothetical protein
MTSPAVASQATIELYERLRRELTMIAGELTVFRELYASDPSNIDLMNRTLPAVMRVIQDALREAVVLGLSRLGDPASQGRFLNLTFASLVVAVRDDGNPALADCLEAHQQAFLHASSNMREWRNKSIAHSDRAVGEGRLVLPPLATEELETALRSAADFLNAFSYPRSQSRTSYALTGFSNDSPLELLRRLRESERYRQEHPRTWMLLGTRAGDDPDDAEVPEEAGTER